MAVYFKAQARAVFSSLWRRAVKGPAIFGVDRRRRAHENRSPETARSDKGAHSSAPPLLLRCLGLRLLGPIAAQIRLRALLIESHFPRRPDAEFRRRDLRKRQSLRMRHGDVLTTAVGVDGL